MQTFAAGGEDL